MLGRAPVGAENYAAAFLHGGLGARGPGMGGAFVAVADDPSAPYYNPAGLAQTRGRAVLASLVPLSLDRLQNSVSAVLNVRGEMGIGFAWLHAGVDDIEARSTGGQRLGSMEDSENAFYAAVGRSLGARVSAGFALKVLQQRIDVPVWRRAEANGHGLDLGIQVRPVPQVVLGVAMRNLGSTLEWKVRQGPQQASNVEDRVPRLTIVGVALRPVAPLLLAADLQRGDETLANLGAECAVSPLLTVRGGIGRLAASRDEPATVAAGLTLRPMRNRAVEFHYAYTTDPLDAGERTVLGLGLAF
ncbi:MAG: hypothetical protein AB1505_03020 [Candidatus Latescibacterota bacterium]